MRQKPFMTHHLLILPILASTSSVISLFAALGKKSLVLVTKSCLKVIYHFALLTFAMKTTFFIQKQPTLKYIKKKYCHILKVFYLPQNISRKDMLNTKHHLIRIYLLGTAGLSSKLL